MRRLLTLTLVFVALAFLSLPIEAQQRRGSLTGRVTDANHGVLQGARVEIEPQNRMVVTDSRGQFTIPDLPPGRYKVTVSYVGFAPFSSVIGLEASSVARVDATMQVEAHAEEVTVHAGRERGEVEAINRERTADNILQVLPAEVITSLPNTNIADAVGRLPSVSLERDEGEGKYVQIRGTEPRLTNVTVGGIHLPSPENVRNVKLDVIPSDLVDSIEVSKTLSANQDADAIGGSVNLVPKSAGEGPYISLLGMGGYTPISGGRGSDQFAATAGDRFGSRKQLGILFGGSYDYNARAIHDIEPAPTVNDLPDGSTFFGPNTIDLRNYAYDRSRWGFGGTIDYKIKDMSSVYLRGLFSKFRDNGEDWIYSPSVDTFLTGPSDANNTCGATAFNSGPIGCGSVGFSDVWRIPSQKIWSLQAGAHHVFGGMLLNYELALSQAEFTGGFGRASFDGPSGLAPNAPAFGIDTSHPFTPQFPVLNGVNIFDPAIYTLSGIQIPDEHTFERDIVGDISLNKPYHLGPHYGSWEIGFKGWDARKTQIFADRAFDAVGQSMTNYLGSFFVKDYYFNRYQVGPTTKFSKVVADFQSNPGNFSNSDDPTGYDAVGNIPNNFDTSERIWAGYAMNTLSFGRVRLQTGIRVEATNDHALGNIVTLDSNSKFQSFTPSLVTHDYINVFPSVQAQFRITDNTILRAGYGMGIARPNFYDFAPYVTFDPNSTPTVSAGNPALKPTHAQNFDVAIERYLKPIGIIQIGGFYKYLTDPIYFVDTLRTIAPFAGETQSQPINGPHAHVGGIELTWQQQLRFLPGALDGLGVRANYSYTTSSASFPLGFGRTDTPSLNRTAPNNWNFDVTYDKKGFSARMGLTHNDAYLWSYQFQDGARGGKRGPLGDTYLYPHTQVDAQVSYWIPRGHGLQAIASFLNLNNEVFGFYNGSEQFPLQREYYSRTISAGLRWTLTREPK